jgi:hypothetical protein
MVMNTTCSRSESVFRHVDRNEDSSPAIESARCSQPGCEVYLCRAGCMELSFQCEDCGNRFCGEHKLTLDGFPFCLTCAIANLETQEPECECRQTDVDLFDARGCELHDSGSRWNERPRAVTANSAV